MVRWFASAAVGSEGLIALAEVSSLPGELKERGREHYTDGKTIWWRFKADVNVINSQGFVPRRQLAHLLGFHENYAFRGFGDRQSGVKRLAAAQYESILAAYLKSQERVIKENERTSRRGTGHSEGGEGPVHRSLKKYIADDPETALREQGLRFFRLEHPFQTNDRVDVLLIDKEGRFVAVEVEVDCLDTEMAGPLQCMKYRAMVAYYYGSRVSEVRTVLAARSIATPVRKKCRSYDIEVVEIPTWTQSPMRS